MHDDHVEAAIYNLKRFLESYHLVKDLSLEKSQQEIELIPSQIIERVARDFLTNTALYLEARPQYGENLSPLPAPDKILEKYKGKQAKERANHAAFKLYAQELFPIIRERNITHTS